jgi:dienelactone hydrolase
MKAYDGQPVAARYYPSNTGANAPVVLLVHENGPGRSGKDFEDPVADLKNAGLAEHLQKEGYAVLVVDLRGHGANPRRALTDPQWKALTFDLQAAYHFLLDRHNRRELNIGKLGVVGLGEGANLVANWAAEPRAAVSIEGRPGDLAALALISPLPEDRATRLAPAVASLAPRVPILAMSGEGDAASADWVKEAKEVVERQRLGKTALVEGKQHGYNLVRFTPGATAPLTSFLELTLKSRPEEWEPRFNLDPVAFTDVQIIDLKSRPAPPAPEAPKAEAPAN